MSRRTSVLLLMLFSQAALSQEKCRCPLSPRECQSTVEMARQYIETEHALSVSEWGISIVDLQFCLFKTKDRNDRLQINVYGTDIEGSLIFDLTKKTIIEDRIGFLPEIG